MHIVTPLRTTRHYNVTVNSLNTLSLRCTLESNKCRPGSNENILQQCNAQSECIERDSNTRTVYETPKTPVYMTAAATRHVTVYLNPSRQLSNETRKMAKRNVGRHKKGYGMRGMKKLQGNRG